MNYVNRVRELLGDALPECEPDLLDFYALLVFTLREQTSDEDVHDAWAIWQNRTQPDHRSLVPFDDLSPAVQAMDAPYRRAIRKVARVLEMTERSDA